MRDDQQLKQEVAASSLKWEAAHGGFITIRDYFGSKQHTDEHTANAVELLKCVNALLAEFVAQGGTLHKDPDTGTYISGSKGGSGDGGYRVPTTTTGRQGSAHKEAMAVDVFDASENLDNWISRDLLVKYDLYREAKQWTPGWTHLQTRPPKSGNRSFNP